MAQPKLFDFMKRNKAPAAASSSSEPAADVSPSKRARPADTAQKVPSVIPPQRTLVDDDESDNDVAVDQHSHAVAVPLDQSPRGQPASAEPTAAAAADASPPAAAAGVAEATRPSDFEERLAAALASTAVPAASSLAQLLQKDGVFTPYYFDGWDKDSASVPFAFLADVLADVSAVGSRLVATKLLAFCYLAVMYRAPNDLLAVLNLTINKLAPAHEGVELGVGDSLLMKAICETCGIAPKSLRDDYAKVGDLAEIAQAKKGKVVALVKSKPLLVATVFANFKAIALMSGKDVQRRRVDTINALLRSAKGPEVNFIVRGLQGKMRIGVAQSSVLQAIGIAVAIKHLSPQRAATMPADELQRYLVYCGDGITRLFHEAPSFDLLVPALLEHGIDTIVSSRLSIQPGIPVKPMLAHATNGITAILDRFNNTCFTCEYKYDGERAQIHYSGRGDVAIYSRNSESHTGKYPDVIATITEAFDPTTVTSFILDSEVVAVDETGALKNFQALQHRGRKNIKLEDVQIQVCLFAFDLLYFNGESLLDKPLRERREILRRHFHASKALNFAKSMDSSDTGEMQTFLDQSIADGCEGLMVKTLDHDAEYTPFKRSYHWLKLKKDYIDGVGDTVDLVPIGGYNGRGKRTGVYGGFLLACYDAENEEFQSVCKIGTGFSDQDLQELAAQLDEQRIASAPPYYRYNETHAPDVWFRDAVVWEVKAADLTLSPVHTAAHGLVDSERGIALRFPRFIKKRDDKQPVDATSASQMAQLYRQQALAQKDAAPAADENDDYC